MDLNLAQVAQIQWDSTRTITAAEGACLHVLGVSADALRQMPLTDALGVPRKRAEELHSVASAEKPATEFVHGMLEGRPRVFRLMIHRRGPDVIACILDVEDVLEHAPPVQISRLSSSLSHEIRNPLSSVKMAVQTLARNPALSERDQRRLAIANREVRTVERMLWLLSEYGRDNFPSLELMALRALVHEAASLVGAELAERKVLLRIDEPTDVARVRVDAGRLRPILAQLLLNVAMGHPEGASLAVQLRHGAEGWTLMVVEDPSATLQPEEKESVFEPFGSMLARGAGLSLAALYQAMKSHGGDVSAEASAPGTRYTLSFPPAEG